MLNNLLKFKIKAELLARFKGFEQVSVTTPTPCMHSVLEFYSTKVGDDGHTKVLWAYLKRRWQILVRQGYMTQGSKATTYWLFLFDS